MQPRFVRVLILAGLLAIPSLPASAQSIDVGSGGVQFDPRSQRDRDEIRRGHRREEFRDRGHDTIRCWEPLRRENDDDDDD